MSIVIPKIRIETTNPQDGPDHITREVSQWYQPLVQLSSSIDTLTTGLAATNKELAATKAAMPTTPPTHPFTTTPGGGGGGSGGGGGGGGVGGQSFVTVDVEPTLSGSRKITAGAGITLTDGGALGNLTVSFSGASSTFALNCKVITIADSAYSPTATDCFIDASSGPLADTVINLPAATGTGRVFIIKKADANPHNIAVTPNGANTIDDVAAAFMITVQYSSFNFIDYAAGKWAIW